MRLQDLATLLKTWNTLYILDCSRSTAQSMSTWQSCFHLFQPLYRFPLFNSEHSFLWHCFSLCQTLHCHFWSCLPRCSLCNQDNGLHCQYGDSAVFAAFPWRFTPETRSSGYGLACFINFAIGMLWELAVQDLGCSTSLRWKILTFLSRSDVCLCSYRDDLHHRISSTAGDDSCHSWL